MKGTIDKVILVIDGKEVVFEPTAISYSSHKEVFESLGNKPEFTGVVNHEIAFTTEEENKG